MRYRIRVQVPLVRLPDTEPAHAGSNVAFVGADGGIDQVDLLVVSTHCILQE